MMNKTMNNATANNTNREYDFRFKGNGILDALFHDTIKNMTHDIEFAIFSVPRDRITWNKAYQIDHRVGRDMEYLRKEWNDAKCMPLIGVYHEDEGLVYLMDGVGRMMVTEGNPDYEYMKVQVIFLRNMSSEDRLKYEAELFAYQNRDVSPLTRMQTHGAFKCMNRKEAEYCRRIDAMEEKYCFKIVDRKRSLGVNEVNYNILFDLIARDPQWDDIMKFINDFCKKSGLIGKNAGYSRYMMYALKSLYKRSTKHDECINILAVQLRPYTPTEIKMAANKLYAKTAPESNIFMMFEDVLEGFKSFADIKEALDYAKEMKCGR